METRTGLLYNFCRHIISNDAVDRNWWPNDRKTQSISNQGVNKAYPEYSGLSTRIAQYINMIHDVA